MNQVLNRPMFRQTALRKGHLTPVRANTGVMIGQPYGPPGPFKPPSTQIAPWYQRLKADFLNSRQGIQQVLKGHKGANPLGSGRGLAAATGYLGVEDLVSRFTGSPYGRSIFEQYGVEPGLKKVALDAGIAAALSFNPYTGPVARGVGLGWTGAQLGKKFLYDPAKNWLSGMPTGDLDTKWGIEEGQKMVDLSGKEQPKTAIQIKKEVENIGPKRKHNRVGFDNKLTQTDNESKVVDGAVDVNKVIDNNIASMLPEGGGVDASKSTYGKPKSNYPEDEELIAVSDKEKITDKKANLNVVKKANAVNNELDKPGKIKAGDGTEVNTEVIDLARKYRKELMAGQKSQAGLVFLANLASGLLSGTTAKAGVGGALEVLGKALGPAVNNYATIKLKENELSNSFMSDALELAGDEIERANEIIEFKMPEYPDGDPGVIQMFDRNNQIVNMRGIRLKDGTVQVAMPGMKDQFGHNVYQTMVTGSFNRFMPNSELDPKAIDTLLELDQKYKAYKYGETSYNLVKSFADKGITGAGPVGRLNLVKSRLGEAMYDLTGMNMFTNTDDAFRKADEYKQMLIDDYMEQNDATEKTARKWVEKEFGEFNLGSGAQNKLTKAISEYTGEADAQKLSQLAINETVMVYALANSLKSKDRLTAKDIKMAKDLVNIFPWFRGQKAVMRDLKSVNNTILQDIKSLENTYVMGLMGETSTINKYRRIYGIGVGAADMAPQEIPGFDWENKSVEEMMAEGWGS